MEIALNYLMKGRFVVTGDNRPNRNIPPWFAPHQESPSVFSLILLLYLAIFLASLGN